MTTTHFDVCQDSVRPHLDVGYSVHNGVDELTEA